MRRAELITGAALVGDPAAPAEETASAYVKTHGLKAADVMTHGRRHDRRARAARQDRHAF